MSWISTWFNWLTSIFGIFGKSLECSIVGLENSGKTSFVNLLAGQWSEDVVPTVAFNMRRVRKDNITFKIWDVAGQSKYRNLWERYCHGSSAIIFIVDAADKDSLASANFELHNLLSEKSLVGIPLLVLGNKNDLPGHVSTDELIATLKLDTVTNREVSCYSCSMKSQHNFDVILKWLAKRAT